MFENVKKVKKNIKNVKKGRWNVDEQQMYGIYASQPPFPILLQESLPLVPLRKKTHHL